MKIHVKFLTDTSREIEIPEEATIQELRIHIAKLGIILSPLDQKNLGEAVLFIGTIRFTDKYKNQCSLYKDDHGDMELRSFFKKNNSSLELTELTAGVVLDLGHGNCCRPTKLNPTGLSGNTVLLYKDRYNSTFFQAIHAPITQKTYSERLKDINFQGDIPERFLDEISFELMDQPMLTSDLHTYDLKTIKDLNHVSPVTNEPFRRVEHHMLLRFEIEEFLYEQEISQYRPS